MDRLTNTIRPYAWGSTTAIAGLLGVEPTGEPQAEMWMGAHPGAPSRTGRGPLNEVIDEDPRGELGPRAVDKFGPRLPFLLKILAAGAPLSVQVHPDLEQAREGYEDEEARGIPLDAPHRNYKDANHKPELICALTPFDGLCGFRPPAEAADLIEGLGVDSLKPYVDLLRAKPEDAALREVLTAVLTADREDMARAVTEAAAAAERLGGAYAPYADAARHFPGDPGVIAAMLLNHVRLNPGEALYLGAGVPHAYLDGMGVEIMANSDNVLRCGLTPKHVDVPELLRVVRFEASDPGVLRPEASADGEEVYDTPIDEFRLSRYVLPEGDARHDLTAETPQILLCVAGEVRAGDISLGPGRSVFVPAGEKTDVSGSGTLFRATVVA
ncbi:mannose-6-phosphate isomerase, class I [Streptomyces spectabilis]|uniref:mannose-6-phosphate isomerase n=1 Tax=Streptomyces spectabilis TaxID=68270 RepID=A0A5P2X5S9_STRST|nr:mannose-6-phosphate isomerase, class I [Streptomyces spectabilis]MBB5107688.1 mannose-6-phosphate isomerase [Streptomyces spectabilis]MCI3903127.1 mannose-6-phosphate isomerase, class I [Streptomyces spectabilis]QEV60367.1 mannose-6-phosphate isomerase, class I [Streptomyces spectabilis]GGV38055.1 mannose-6-phosphate isomerase, class I [Streptomyces spectabilis]